jgi:hypothetical protein
MYKNVYIVQKAAIPLVLLSDGMILYIRTDLAFECLCSKDSHFKLEIIDVTSTAPGSWT